MDVVGTFEACIEKEKNGGMSKVSETRNKVEELAIENAANDIGLPIYIFNLEDDMQWSRFSPKEQFRKQCRYYITLVRYIRVKNNQEYEAFNRVTPDHELCCNCSLNPPLVGKYNALNK